MICSIMANGMEPPSKPQTNHHSIDVVEIPVPHEEILRRQLDCDIVAQKLADLLMDNDEGDRFKNIFSEILKRKVKPSVYKDLAQNREYWVKVFSE